MLLPPLRFFVVGLLALIGLLVLLCLASPLPLAHPFFAPVVRDLPLSKMLYAERGRSRIRRRRRRKRERAQTGSVERERGRTFVRLDGQTAAQLKPSECPHGCHPDREAVRAGPQEGDRCGVVLAIPTIRQTSSAAEKKIPHIRQGSKPAVLRQRQSGDGRGADNVTANPHEMEWTELGIGEAVVSATRRFLRSIARWKIARGWPWAVSSLHSGAGRL